MRFSPEDAAKAAACEAGGVLLRLRDEGVEITPEHPLLYFVPQRLDSNYIDYVNSGNFGLKANVPGSLLRPGSNPPLLGNTNCI